MAQTLIHSLCPLGRVSDMAGNRKVTIRTPRTPRKVRPTATQRRKVRTALRKT
jgi:hypothetical protein